MRIRYHEPLGNPNNTQDPLPKNWQEVSAKAGPYPKNFGVVEEGRLYRSGIVWAHQVPNLGQRYGIKNIVTLLDGDWLQDFDNDPDITIHQFPILERKELTFERVKNVVKIIESSDAPSLVCCLKGAARTGMVVAGYNILSQKKSNIEAIAHSILYGNFNRSVLKEISNYRH